MCAVHVPRILPVALSTPVSFAWRALPLRSMFTVVFLLLLTVRAEQQSGRSDVGRRLQQQVRLFQEARWNRARMRLRRIFYTLYTGPEMPLRTSIARPDGRFCFPSSETTNFSRFCGSVLVCISSRKCLHACAGVLVHGPLLQGRPATSSRNCCAVHAARNNTS